MPIEKRDSHEAKQPSSPQCSLSGQEGKTADNHNQREEQQNDLHHDPFTTTPVGKRRVVNRGLKSVCDPLQIVPTHPTL